MALFPDSPYWIIVLATGIVAGLVFTRVARQFALRLGLVDGPDGRRKMQERPVPNTGGVAVFFAALVALGVTALVSPAAASVLTADPRRTIALLVAAAILVTVGLIDDRYNLRARYKLVGQMLAALVVILLGHVVIEKIALFRWVVDLGQLGGPITLFWLLACVNALNLIDGMDGMLGTVGVISLGCLAVMAGSIGHPFTVLVALALAGAVIGFLRYNLPPATIYMGDAGSMLIGLVLGTLAISAELKGPATVGLGASLALLLLPMLDTTAAVIRRKLTGRGLATTDRGHLHHVLLRSGLSVRRALMLVAALALVAASGALATTASNNDVFAVIAVLGVVITLIATRLFGNAEFRLVKKRIARIWRGIISDGVVHEIAVHLQGTADWDDVWQDLTGCAERLNLQTVCLDVNAPALHENFHARWDWAGLRTPESHLWRLDIPLFGHGQPIGRLIVSGGRDDEPIADKLLTLSKIIETAEVGATEVTSNPARPATATADSPTATSAAPAAW